MSKRKQNSIFNAICTYINNVAVGSTFKLKDLREQMSKTHVSHADVMGGMPYKVSADITQLLTTKCIVRESRGIYKVVGHIPDFVTLSTCDANRGYKKIIGKWKREGNQYALRGKPWKLGDPPIERKPKAPRTKKIKQKEDVVETAVKNKLILLAQIEGCFKMKKHDEAVIAMAEGIGPVHVFEISEMNPEMIHISGEGVVDWVEVTKLKEIRVVDVKEYRKILYNHRDVFEMRDFGKRGLQPDSYKTDSHLKYFQGTDTNIVKFGENITRILKTDKPNIFKIKFWPALVDDMTDKHVEPVLVRLVKESDEQLKEKIVAVLKEGLSAVDAAEKIIKML